MQIMRMSDHWNKVNTKEELLSLLEENKLILTDYVIEYLNSLIELEFSVMRDYISKDARKALSELEVYKRIAIYNIYYRALNIFKKDGTEFKISGNNDGIEGLTVYAPLGERSAKLFEFNYQEGSTGFQSQIPNGYKIMHIGNISLFQTIENEEQREAELMRVMSILDRLYDEKNPYHFRLHAYSGPASQFRSHTYGGPAPQWALEHSNKIRKYEEKFKQLDSKKELTDEEKREIEITKQFHELLLEDYGLTNKSFEEENNESIINGRQTSKLQKTLVIKQPNLTIRNHIRYI